MDDGIAAFDELVDRCAITEVTDDRLLMIGSRSEVDDIRDPDDICDPLQATAHCTAQSPGSSRQQKPLHAMILPDMIANLSYRLPWVGQYRKP